MFKTLPVFVIEYGQAVCRKGEHRRCLNTFFNKEKGGLYK